MSAALNKCKCGGFIWPDRKHNPSMLKFPCSHCSKTFLDKNSLSRHRKNVHSPKIACEFCEKKLKIVRLDAYRTHLVRCKAFSKYIDSTDKDRIYEAAYSQSKLLQKVKTEEEQTVQTELLVEQLVEQ